MLMTEDFKIGEIMELKRWLQDLYCKPLTKESANMILNHIMAIDNILQLLEFKNDRIKSLEKAINAQEGEISKLKKKELGPYFKEFQAKAEENLNNFKQSVIQFIQDPDSFYED